MTRYAVRTTDGRYLTKAIHGGQPVWIWLHIAEPVTTFDSITAAHIAIWGSEGPDLGCTDPWTVVPIAGKEADSCKA